MAGVDSASGANAPKYVGLGTGPSDTESGAPIEGSYRGQQVAVEEDPLSLLADAAEELTFGASEQVEKKVGERKLKSEQHIVKVAHTEESELRTQTLKDLDPEALKKFLAQLKETGANADAIKDLAQRTFEDPTQRHAALSEALKQLSEDATYADLSQAVDTVLTQFEATEGPQIRAGYNIDGVDSSTVGSPQQGRDLYRETVLGNADIAQTFTTLMDKFGPDNFQQALQFLIQAVGADVSSSTPSTDKTALFTANSDLYQVELLGNLYRDTEKLLDNVDKTFGIETGVKPFGLMKETLRLKDARLVDPTAIRSLLDLKGEEAPTRDVALVKGYKDLVYRLPLKIYNDPTTRQTLLNGIQSVLDEAITVEEATLPEEEGEGEGQGQEKENEGETT